MTKASRTTWLPPFYLIRGLIRDLASKLDRSSNFCLDEGSEVSAFVTALNEKYLFGIKIF